MPPPNGSGLSLHAPVVRDNSDLKVIYPWLTVEKMTPQEFMDCWMHFPSFCYHFLYVWAKPGADGFRHLVPLKFNGVQSVYWPLRKPKTACLKDRQGGLTTIEQAHDFWISVTRPAAGVLLLAHSQEIQTACRLRVQTFLENLPERGKVKVARDNREGFVFDSIPGLGIKLDSEYGIKTVSGKHKGIGKTLLKIHLTEVARWEDVPGGFDNYIGTMLQTLPESGEAVIETTANGIGNTFHRLWQKAEEGKGAFIPVFIPWWHDETCVRTVPKDFKVKDDKEAALLAIGGTPGHVLFRRAKVVELTSSEYDGEAMFNQEYPSDAKTCFISGGKNAFPTAALLEQGERIKAEKTAYAVHNKVYPHVGDIYPHVVGPKLEYAFSSNPCGGLEMWEPPIPGCRYVIGADTGKGKETGDFSAGCVLKIPFSGEEINQVAEFRALPYPDEFAEVLRCMGYYYNTAWLVPERNTDGQTVIMSLLGMLYPNVYQSQKMNKGFVEDTFSYGWYNTEGSRAVVINLARTTIFEKGVRIRSQNLLDELFIFARSKAGKYEAPDGAHDDCAMAFMIALWGVTQCAAPTLENYSLIDEPRRPMLPQAREFPIPDDDMDSEYRNPVLAALGM